jgi:hypothetical protein
VIAFLLTIATSRVAESFMNSIYLPYWHFLLGSVVSGMVFGIIGSSIALRRFLR